MGCTHSNTSAVLKFPADGGPAIGLGDPITSPISLAIAPDGDIYVTNASNTALGDYVARITPSGETSTFDLYTGVNEAPISITIDDFENVYVLTSSARRKVYVYAAGDPDSREILAECSQAEPGICTPGTLAMAPDQSSLYVAALGRLGFRLLAIDQETGAFRQLALGNGAGYGSSYCGMAVVPLRGDLNGNHIADLDDYQLMAECVGAIEDLKDCAVADLDLDGDVDLFDFRFFQWAFGGIR